MKETEVVEAYKIAFGINDDPIFRESLRVFGFRDRTDVDYLRVHPEFLGFKDGFFSERKKKPFQYLYDGLRYDMGYNIGKSAR